MTFLAETMPDCKHDVDVIAVDDRRRGRARRNWHTPSHGRWQRLRRLNRWNRLSGMCDDLRERKKKVVRTASTSYNNVPDTP